MIGLFRKHIICKLIALSVCLTFVWQSAAPIGAAHAQAVRPSLSAGNSSAHDNVDPASVSLPVRLGEIMSQFKGPLDKTIIHIRDAHCDYSAQHSIAGMVGYFRDTYGVDLIALEGGTGDYDLSVFTDIKDKELREKVADYFVQQGEVNGAEFYAINNPEKVTLYGIEDPALYIENLKAYRNSLKFKDKALAILGSMAEEISKQKDRIYPSGFRELDKKMRLFKEDRIGFEPYAVAIAAYAKNNNMDISEYPNIERFYYVMDRESGINMKEAERERNILIDLLNKQLSKRYLEELVVKTVEFNDGNMPVEEYYAYLLDKARLCGIGLDKMQQLLKYADTAKETKTVDKKALEKEFKALEEKMCASFLKTSEERALCALDKKVFILNRLFSVGLVKDDWDYYVTHRKDFDIKEFAPLNGYRMDMEKFYELSLKRDDIFMNNIAGKLENEEQKNIILVTGGFHQDNLKRLFMDRGYSYIEVLPKVGGADGESPYFRLLSGGADPITKAVSESRSNLQIASYLSGELGQNKEAFRLAVGIVEQLIRDGRSAKTSGTDAVFSLYPDEGTLLLVDREPVSVGGQQVYVSRSVSTTQPEITVAPDLGKQAGEANIITVPKSYRRGTSRMPQLITSLGEISDGINSAVKKDLGMENPMHYVALADLSGNSIDAIMERLDGEYDALDEFEQSEFNAKGSVKINSFRNETTGEVSIVVSNDGLGIEPSVMNGWLQDIFKSTKKWKNPEDAPIYFAKGGFGIPHILGDAKNNNYKITFITRQSGEGTGRMFEQDLYGNRRVVSNVPREGVGTDVIITIPSRAIISAAARPAVPVMESWSEERCADVSREIAEALNLVSLGGTLINTEEWLLRDKVTGVDLPVFVRVGYLLFLNENMCDELKNGAPLLWNKVEGNVIKIRPFDEDDRSIFFKYGDWTVMTIRSMIDNAGIIKGRRVIDVGAGSGLLSIVAMKLGASSVELIENNPEDISNAVKHLNLNGVDSGYKTHSGDLRKVTGLAGREETIVVSNIGTWEGQGGYEVSNRDSINLIREIPNVVLFIGGGYKETGEEFKVSGEDIDYLKSVSGRDVAAKRLTAAKDFEEGSGYVVAWSASLIVAKPVLEVSYADRRAAILNAGQKIKDIVTAIFRNLFDGKPIKIYVLGATPTKEGGEQYLELEHSSDLINERNQANRAINERTGIGTGNIDVSHTIGLDNARKKIADDILQLRSDVPKERVYCAISAFVLEGLEKDIELKKILGKGVQEFLEERTMLSIIGDFTGKNVYLMPYLETTILGLARINLLSELSKSNDINNEGVREAMSMFSKAMGLVSDMSEEDIENSLKELLAAANNDPMNFFKNHTFRLSVPPVTKIRFEELREDMDAMIQTWRSL